MANLPPTPSLPAAADRWDRAGERGPDLVCGVRRWRTRDFAAWRLANSNYWGNQVRALQDRYKSS